MNDSMNQNKKRFPTNSVLYVLIEQMSIYFVSFCLDYTLKFPYAYLLHLLIWVIAIIIYFPMKKSYRTSWSYLLIALFGNVTLSLLMDYPTINSILNSEALYYILLKSGTIGIAVILAIIDAIVVLIFKRKENKMKLASVQ